MTEILTDHLLIAGFFLGFCAQMIGSSLGMAYSVTCSSVLLAMGFPPAVTSATVHTSEVVNRLSSGLSHFRFGNVDSAIFKQLALAGMAGALCGALVVTSLPLALLRPMVACILLLMGLRILRMACFAGQVEPRATRLTWLGFTGGVVDVVGGGGWGPVVASTLVLRGNATHLVVGSVNFAKFFVAVVESVVLLALVKIPQWSIICGLVAGGLLASPLAAWGCRKLPPRTLMVMVGILVCGLSIRTLVKVLQ